MRSAYTMSSEFYPPPSYQGFTGSDFITTTDSSATCSPITNPCLSACKCLVFFAKKKSPKKTSKQVSPVNQQILLVNSSVKTFNCIRILGVGILRSLTPIKCQKVGSLSLCSTNLLDLPSHPTVTSNALGFVLVFPPIRRLSSS